MPRPGPGRGAGRGGPLRHLRLRHPHDPRGLGQARRGRGPRVERRRRRRRRRASTDLGGRRRRRRRSVAPVRPLPALPRGPAVAVREPRALDDRGRAQRRCLRRLHRGRRSGRCCACPTGLDPRDAALAEPLAVALHGITRGRASATGDSVMVLGAGPIGALSIAALVARGLGPVTVVEPGDARARSWPAQLGADRGARPDRPRGVPGVGARPHLVAGRRRGARVLRQAGRPWRPASTSCGGAGASSWSAPASSPRRSTPTGCSSTS